MSTTQKNGPASVGALPSRGSTNSRKENDMNESSNTTAAPVAAREHPATRMFDAARELRSAMLANPDAPGLMMVFADPAMSHPIVSLEQREYAQLSRLTWAYRDAHRAMCRAYQATFAPNESVPLPELPQHKRYWDAFHACTRAHMALLEAFDAYDHGTIEGEAA